MGSPELSSGAAPPDPVGAACRWHRMTRCDNGDTAPALCPAAGGLCCRAVLLLAVCLSATALPHILSSLVALSPAPSSQQGMSGSLVTLHGDLLAHPRRARMDAEGTLGCFRGEAGSYHGTDAEDLGTSTGAVTPELGASSVPASHPPAPSNTSHAQGEALGAATPTGSQGGQEGAPHLEPLLGLSPALPSEGTPSWDGIHPSTTWMPAVTPGGPDAGREAALLVGTTGAEVLADASGLVASTSLLPSSATSHGVSHPGVLPTEGFGGAAVTLEEPGDPSPAHQALPAPTEAHPVPTWTWFPITTGPTEAGESSASPGATPEPAATEAPCQDGAAAVPSWYPNTTDVTQGSLLGLHTQMPSPAGPPEPTADPMPPPSPTPPAAEPCTSSPPPSHPPAPSTAAHAQSSQTPTAPTSAAHPTPSPLLVTSWHPSAARDDVPTATSWVAAGETFTPGQFLTMSNVGSTGTKPPVCTLLLSFRLLGIIYTKALSQKSSGSYRELEKEVRMMLHQTLSTYQTFLQANILAFTNGSVLVQAEAAFWGEAPSSSHLIRTLVAGASQGRDAYSWWLEPRSISTNGFSVENLDPEKLSISFTVLGGVEPVERLIGEVTRPLHDLYPVRNFTLGRLRSTHGDLEVAGDLYLDTTTHANVTVVLQALTALAACSVDLSSLSVQGARLLLQVYPFSFLVTNWRFSEDLLDPLNAEHRELSRALADVVAKALRDHGSFLQAVIRGFLPGSLLCHGDVVFQPPAPSSLEVLEALVLAVGPDEALAGSEFQVDPYSIAVGEDTLEPPPAPSLPEHSVAIVLVCILIIITVPVILLGCLRTRRLGWRDVAVLWDRRDPEVGTQTLEMEEQGFWAASDEAPEEAAERWCKDSSAC